MITQDFIKYHFPKVDIVGKAPLIKKLQEVEQDYEINLLELERTKHLSVANNHKPVYLDRSRKVYIDRERKLNFRDISLRREIGILLQDPCQNMVCKPYRITTNKGCKQMTESGFCKRFGLWVKVNIKTYRKRRKFLTS